MVQSRYIVLVFGTVLTQYNFSHLPHEVFTMAVSKRALMKANSAAASARARLAKIRKQYEQPNYKALGAQALGGAIPAYLPNITMLPADFMGVPVEGFIGAGLIIASGNMKGDNRSMVEGLGSGMVAVTAYKLAKQYNEGQ